MAWFTSTPPAESFSLCTRYAPAVFGGTGPQRHESLGLGTFALSDIPAGALLKGRGERVPLILEEYRAGRQVKINDTQAYDLTGVDHLMYYVNCQDEKKSHKEFPDYRDFNVKFSQYKQDGVWRFALRTTCAIAVGQQLLLPPYLVRA